MDTKVADIEVVGHSLFPEELRSFRDSYKTRVAIYNGALSEPNTKKDFLLVIF